MSSCYVNPKDETKEEFLLREGKQIPDESYASISEDALPVCLVFNDQFTAGAIAYSLEELARFSNGQDRRAKLWYMVPREKLLEVSDLKHFL